MSLSQFKHFTIENSLFKIINLTNTLIDLKNPHCYPVSPDENIPAGIFLNNVFHTASRANRGNKAYGLILNSLCSFEDAHPIVFMRNKHFMARDSTAIHFRSGALQVKDGVFRQVESNSGNNGNNYATNRSYAIDYRYTKDSEVHYHSEITGTEFDTNGFSNVIAINLSHASRENNHRVKIAYNTFRGVERAVAFSDRSGGVLFYWLHHPVDIIAEGSVCNYWIPSEFSPEDRCHGSPAEGFIHFADGEICGEAPEGFSMECPPLPVVPTSTPSPDLIGKSTRTSLPVSSEQI